MSQITVIFNFKGKIANIQFNAKDKMNNICEKFISQLKEDCSKLYFKYNGNLIKEELKL